MDRELTRTIGAAARRARSALGLTQADAAERIGISTEFYARIERGGTLPSVPTLVQMAEALEISADGLLGREDGRGNRPRIARENAAERDSSPEVRRLLRRVRKAKPRTVKLLNLLVSALEE